MSTMRAAADSRSYSPRRGPLSRHHRQGLRGPAAGGHDPLVAQLHARNFWAEFHGDADAPAAAHRGGVRRHPTEGSRERPPGLHRPRRPDGRPSHRGAGPPRRVRRLGLPVIPRRAIRPLGATTFLLMTATCRRLVAVLIMLLLTVSLAPMAPAGADQCAPPGVQSASALPTNLAAAAKGPDEDKYTTPTVEPLSAVDLDALGLSTPGTLTVGTLSDAPPSICINSQGPVHRVRQRTAAGDRRQAGPEDQLRRHRVLRAARAGRRAPLRRRLVVDHHHRRPAAHRRLHQRLRLRLLLARRAAGLADHRASTSSAAGQRIGVVQGTVQEAYVVDTLHLEPVKFPDYNTVYASLKTRQIDAWVAPSQQAQGTVQPGDPARDRRKHLQLGQFRRLRGRQGEQAADRRAQLPASTPSSPTAPGRGCTPTGCRARCRRAGSRAPRPRRVPQLPDFAAIAASHQKPRRGPTRWPPKSTLTQLATSFLDWDLYKTGHPRPAQDRPAQHPDPDDQRQRHRPAARAWCSRSRGSRGRRGCGGRRGSTPTSSAVCPRS